MATLHANCPAYCRRCGRDTPTVLAPLRCGHIGRLCAVCRSLRHPRPWATRDEYQRTLTPPAPRTAAEGAHEYANHHA